MLYVKEEPNLITMGNEYYELQIKIGKTINPCFIKDKSSGMVFADGDYCYSIQKIVDNKKIETDYINYISHSKEGNKKVTLTGKIEGIKVIQEYLFSDKKSSFEERISIINEESAPINISKLGLGFTKKLVNGTGIILPELMNYRMAAIPFRREIYGEDYRDYSIADLILKRGWQNARRIMTEELSSEGWVWTDGNYGLVTINYSQEKLVYSLLKLEPKSDGHYLRYGGVGLWNGTPEVRIILNPEEQISFGITHYEFIKGDWKEGYYAFRSVMDEHGHRLKRDFNPPVHWNELYDNPLWWQDVLWEKGYPEFSRQQLKESYHLELIKEEAKKAQEIDCESLYLDPVWDTGFASSVWDTERMGDLENFVKLMKEKYSLEVSLHTPLAAWCDPTNYPEDALRIDKDGKTIPASLCSGAGGYFKIKLERLLTLAGKGVAFLMFDGSQYTGECWSRHHGHPIPYTLEDHCKAYLKLCQEIHHLYPEVIIEMHDMGDIKFINRHCPIYYLHGLSHSYDEIWAFEFMWQPMDDLISGRAKSLYYYNLAYNIPLYLHIDLRYDNENCLMFWWYASTCRHLGIGGKHWNFKNWNKHKMSMMEYLKLKKFYTQGIFYGIEETVHVHTLPEAGQAVFNIFNLTDEPVKKEVEFRLDEIGLSITSRDKITIKGTQFTLDEKTNKIKIIVDLLPKAHILVQIN